MERRPSLDSDLKRAADSRRAAGAPGAARSAFSLRHRAAAVARLPEDPPRARRGWRLRRRRGPPRPSPPARPRGKALRGRHWSPTKGGRSNSLKRFKLSTEAGPEGGVCVWPDQHRTHTLLRDRVQTLLSDRPRTRDPPRSRVLTRERA